MNTAMDILIYYDRMLLCYVDTFVIGGHKKVNLSTQRGREGEQSCVRQKDK